MRFRIKLKVVLASLILLILVLFVASIAFIFFSFSIGPLRGLPDYIDVSDATPGEKLALLGSQVEAMGVVTQIFGGFFLIVALISGFQSVNLTQRQLSIAQEGQITERFTRAIDQIGASYEDRRPRLEIRLGGIYALQRIAKDSVADRVAVVEILTAYVRQNAPRTFNKQESKDRGEKIRPDIQTIINMIGSLANEDTVNHSGYIADFSYADLRGAVASERTPLERVDFSNSLMQGVVFEKAKLRNTSFAGAVLEAAALSEADMTDAKLSLANLNGAYLIGAHLLNADLRYADLRNADLRNADMAGALLEGARLEGANLLGATGLTRKQLSVAVPDEATQVPDLDD